MSVDDQRSPSMGSDGPRRIAVAQIGARRHYAVPRALQMAGCLERLYTDFYLPDLCQNPMISRWIGRLGGRCAPGLSSSSVHDFPGFYLRRLAQRRLAAKNGRAGELHQWLQQNREFGRLVCGAGSGHQGRADAVLAFNGAALEILQTAEANGLSKIVDQTAPALSFEESILDEEGQRWTGWEPVRQRSRSLDEIVRRSCEREVAEWQLADRIVCGSRFAADTLEDRVNPEKVAVVDYPSPIFSSPTVATAPVPHHGRLRVLFAGTLGLRKGLPWLKAAVDRCGGSSCIDLRLVGPSQLLPKKLSELSDVADVRGAVSRVEMAEHYRWADVMVLPTLSEGSANVCHEAMAAGRAVITTPHAGSVVRDGIDGAIVPVRDFHALAAALAELIDSPGLIAERGENALLRTSQFTFERYTNDLLAAIRGDHVSSAEALSLAS